MELHLTNLVPDQIVKALCNTLIHSLWQGLILAALTGLTIVLTKKASAALRYNLMIGLSVLFTAGITVTFFTQLRTAEIRQSTPISITTQTQVFQAAPTQVIVTEKPQSILSNCIGFFNAHSNTVVLIWFLVICARFVQLAAGLHNIYHIKRTQVLSAGKHWNDQIRILSHQMGIKQAVKLMQSGIAKIPMVLGHFKPVILIPIGLLTALSAEEVQSILVHELAHIHRRDFLVNLLQNLMEIVFFFNPAVLWVSSLIKTERENCCDDIVLAQTSNKVSYIKALVSCQEYQENMPAYAMGLGGNSDHFLQRAKRMLSNNNQSLNRVEKMVLIICMVVFGLGISAFTAREHIKKTFKSVATIIHHSVIGESKSLIKAINDKTVNKQSTPANKTAVLLAQLPKPALSVTDTSKLAMKQLTDKIDSLRGNSGAVKSRFDLLSKPDTNKQAFKILRVIGQELYREHLITDTNHLNITTNLDKRELIVNGVRMPDDVYQRIYTKFYKKGESDGYIKPRFQSDADKTNDIISDMMKDGIVAGTDDLSFKIGTTEFVVDYKKQPEAAYQKYRAKYVPSRPKGDWIWFYHFDTNKWDQMTGRKNSSDFDGSATGVFQGKEDANSSGYNSGDHYHQNDSQKKYWDGQQRKIIDQMQREGLIDNRKDLSFTLTGKTFVINGLVQGGDVFERYRHEYVPANAGDNWTWNYNGPPGYYSAYANGYRNSGAYYQSSREMQKRLQDERDKKLVADLLQDGLISDPDNVTFSISDKKLEINGKKQSDEIYKKYKDKYLPDNTGTNWDWTYSHHGNK